MGTWAFHVGREFALAVLLLGVHDELSENFITCRIRSLHSHLRWLRQLKIPT